MNKYLTPTGNERISLPQIDTRTAAISDFTFLHMGYKGMIDVRGSNEIPLMQPFVRLDGKQIISSEPVLKRLHYWIPQIENQEGPLCWTATILTPVEERGFLYRITLQNSTSSAIEAEAGLNGCWDSTWHSINEDKPISAEASVYESNWNEGIVFDLRKEISIFSFAPMSSHPHVSSYTQTKNSIHYSLTCLFKLQPNEVVHLDWFWGIGFEEVASTTSAKEMLRQGFDALYEKTTNWLKKRSCFFDDPIISNIYHMNLFFNFFYATGITLDTEELVLITSRSPRYYVSAAYWDRDSLLWSFPSILQADPDAARNMLDYVFTKQIRNVGIHSRYIDGTVLEPGFELDELCAPLLALSRYIDATSDLSYLTEPHVIKGVRHILAILKTKKHPEYDLYETFLQPTDDMHVYRYITYNNILVWRVFCNTANLYENTFTEQEITQIRTSAKQVKQAISQHCVKKVDGKFVYAWSVDLKGSFDIYDEPPGSLQLLAYHGFCHSEDPVFLNTVDLIRDVSYPYSFSGANFSEIGCPHAPHPWVLSIANSLLYGRIAHCTDILHRITMDNLIACESIDETTGESTTGDAFATCAGFLAYAIRKTLVS